MSAVGCYVRRQSAILSAISDVLAIFIGEKVLRVGGAKGGRRFRSWRSAPSDRNETVTAVATCNGWLEECWPLQSRVRSCERRVVEQLVDRHSRKPITIDAYAAVLWQAVRHDLETNEIEIVGMPLFIGRE